MCISVPWLTLPESGADNPLPEQAFGLSLLYLITAVSQASIMADRSRFGAILLDEAWALTANEHGKALVEQIIRAGRKEYVAAWLASQLPTDYPSEIADQVDIKMVFRQAGKATVDALQMLGLPATADRVELVERHLARGRCIFRDVRGSHRPHPGAARHRPHPGPGHPHHPGRGPTRDLGRRCRLSVGNGVRHPSSCARRHTSVACDQVNGELILDLTSAHR